MFFPQNYFATNTPIIEKLIDDLLMRLEDRTSIIVGLSAPQGSGKTTLSFALKQRLEAKGKSCQIIGIDDFYLTRVERQEKMQIHPLLQTRGVPGTHDHIWLLRTLQQLKNNQQTSMPRFDKLVDDRTGECSVAPASVVIFEGWCVGCRVVATNLPQSDFEKKYDPHGDWFKYVNEQIELYQSTFDLIDYQIYLSIPSFSYVFQWRKKQQENDMKRMTASARKNAVMMNAQQLQHFIAHYAPITKQMMRDLPLIADATIYINEQQKMESIALR